MTVRIVYRTFTGYAEQAWTEFTDAEMKAADVKSLAEKKLFDMIRRDRVTEIIGVYNDDANTRIA